MEMSSDFTDASIENVGAAGSSEVVAPRRKPRLALMGEFSAGKSTLSNMLLGADPLPVRITATRLPPVWISYGDRAAYRVGIDGSRSPIEVETLDQVPLEDTRLIRLFMKSDALQLCDLIDMPGISDPNMSAQVWQGVIDEADCVVWCTHATQAWRQSEAATWEQVIDKTNGDNLLLVTQFDKLQSDRDRSRVMARIRAETEGRFQAVYPISLTQALNAGEDSDKWEQSGAGAFTEHLIEMLLSPSALADREEEPEYGLAEAMREAPALLPVESAPAEPESASFLATEAADPSEPRITPKRVRRNRAERVRTRLPASAVSDVIPAVKDMLDVD
ncbi:dynamin family protein [Seohaeicola saemankumensis]|nr:dynamin family protein [Seohaeicola saemankumensis]MCA0869799.1 dynamin family protein [Seohaeicola saemankumensis]